MKTKYCHYDDYLYQDCWIGFIVDIIKNKKITKLFWKDKYKNFEK